MKKLIAIGAVATMVAATSVQAQGWMTVVNGSTSLVTASDSAAAVWGVATGTATPKGATGGLSAQAYYSTTADGALNPVGTAGAFSTAAAGRFNLGNVEIPGVATGQDVWVQVRAWENKYGNSYTAALNAGAQDGRTAILGQSGVFKIAAGSALQPTVLSAAGLQGFSVSVVPEPSTLALGALGLAGLFLLRRRS